MGVNKVIILGNLGKDPEMKYTANGKAYTSFSVAVNEGYGENKRTEWFSVVAWDKTAESCAQYLTKGSEVYVEGRMQTRSWDDKGTKKYRTELVANTVQFLGGKRGEIDPDDIPFEEDD